MSKWGKANPAILDGTFPGWHMVAGAFRKWAAHRPSKWWCGSRHFVLSGEKMPHVHTFLQEQNALLSKPERLGSFLRKLTHEDAQKNGFTASVRYSQFHIMEDSGPTITASSDLTVVFFCVVSVAGGRDSNGFLQASFGFWIAVVHDVLDSRCIPQHCQAPVSTTRRHEHRRSGSKGTGRAKERDPNSNINLRCGYASET